MSSIATSDPALRAAGIVGIWNTNVPVALSVLDEGAARLLAGNVDLAGRPIPLSIALGRTHPDDRDWVFDRIRRVRETGGSTSTEFRIVTETGEVRWILNRGFLAPDANGVMRGRGAYIDTTDSHQVPFISPEANKITEGDPLIEAADRCIGARNAITRTGNPDLLRLSNLVLLEIGRVLAARMRS
ncbi:PAS domain-containing protein [Methylobacterium sp. E-045]|uniref:PAS domain-containing protein n=1 Tax=Methylobacterium sp. E-045 TaxID=2836575 RepID=UPI002444799D|nr:PAS domain-containing protein [Methylobacterium sp. E-045]MCJ2131316.1 PAS domain-containing protein [Methylobacterium sp. E-045]